MYTFLTLRKVCSSHQNQNKDNKRMVVTGCSARVFTSLLASLEVIWYQELVGVTYPALYPKRPA